MIATVSKSFTFEAAHSLPHLPEGHQCRRLHGHSYGADVTCEGPVDERGFVIDYAEIAEVWRSTCHPLLDHRNLDELLQQSTAEHLAAWILSQLQEAGLLFLSSVTVRETATTSVTVKA